MPIYEYACEKCGPFEVTQKISEPALKKHPDCGGKAQRLISSTSFALKGGGWYSDLYSSGGSKSSGEKKSGDSGSGGKSAA